jgi:hypothetical protein
MINQSGAWKVGVLFLALFASRLEASVVQLNYDVIPESGGEYHYDFIMTLTNIDGAWSLGYGFNWIVFGAAGFGLPLTGFVFAAVPPPFQYGTTSGAPTLIDTGNTGKSGGWLPSAVGDVLTLSGYANVNVPQGELYWYYNFGWDNNQLAIATEVTPSVPEPALAISDGIMVGLFALTALRRRSVATSDRRLERTSVS